MILFLILLFQSKAFAIADPSLIYQNNSAVKLFAKEKILESKTVLENEVVNHPKESVLHYNMGVVHENSKEPEKAIQEYLSSTKMSENKELQFYGYFNAARAYGEQKDIPNALKNYQAALGIRPDSVEVKTNIELLIKNGGGGGGGNDDKDQKSDQDKDKDKKEGKDQKKPDQPNKPPDKPKDGEQKKPAPKPFKSEELSEQDVKRVLNELKRQEEQIRAKMNNEKSKETPVEKDW
jgi:Ca-activated chloride channel family protein